MYMQKISLEQVKGSWSYNHKQLIIILALATVIIVQEFPVPTVFAKTNTVEYTSAGTCDNVECLVEKRAVQIFTEKEGLYREMARTDAMEEIGHQVVRMMYVE